MFDRIERLEFALAKCKELAASMYFRISLAGISSTSEDAEYEQAKEHVLVLQEELVKAKAAVGSGNNQCF